MIYLKLFLSFLEIGAFSFGGGYGMLSIIRETVIANSWLSEDEFLNFIAVAESTPGPIAVNMATFIGSEEGGILGALCATLGVVLPSFVIILTIVALISNFLKYKGVNAFFDGIKPCVVGLIIATSLTIGISTLFSFSSLKSKFSPDITGIIIFAIILAVHFIYKKIKKKKISPILMIIISAILGMILYR